VYFLPSVVRTEFHSEAYEEGVLYSESKRTEKESRGSIATFLRNPFISSVGGGEVHRPPQPGGDAPLHLPLLLGGGGRLHYLVEGSVMRFCHEVVAFGLLTSNCNV